VTVTYTVTYTVTTTSTSTSTSISTTSTSTLPYCSCYTFYDCPQPAPNYGCPPTCCVCPSSCPVCQSVYEGTEGIECISTTTSTSTSISTTSTTSVYCYSCGYSCTSIICPSDCSATPVYSCPDGSCCCWGDSGWQFCG
jgi:hypothetical protein